MFKAPTDAQNLTIDCARCATAYTPPWTRRLEFETAPFQSADGATWAPAGIPTQCTHCGAENFLKFPEVPSGAAMTFYGDEAARDISRSGVALVYALVAMSDELRAKLHGQIVRAQAMIRPKDKPDDWKFHRSDLRDERWRRKHGVKLTIQEINDEIRTLARFIAAPKPSRFISVTTIVSEGPLGSKARQKLQEYALSAAPISTTDAMTKQNFTPFYVFESQNDDHRRNGIDYTVEKVGRSLRHDLTYLWACRGKASGLPVTAEKASTADLVAADIVAFMTARYIQRTDIKRHTEFDLSMLGEVHWGMFTLNGFLTHPSIGFPLDYFDQHFRRL
jgi:hypothetical protein